MDREQDDIMKQMESTRASLADKLGALETQVSDTVKTATDAVESTKEAVAGTVEAVKDTVASVTESVQGTVSNVTDSVTETVKSVGEVFNLPLQAERNPWLVFGGAVAVGCLGAYLLGPSRRRESAAGQSETFQSRQAYTPSDTHTGAGIMGSDNGSSVVGAATAAAGGAASAVGGWLWDQVGKFKGLAIGATMNVVRTLAEKNLPEEVGHKLAGEVDKLTRTLGGEPLQGDVLPDDWAKFFGLKDEGESREEGATQQETEASSASRSDTPNWRNSAAAGAGHR